MILKQKKKLVYALSFLFGLVLTVFAAQKDNHAKYELADGLIVPVANADTPLPPGDAANWTVDNNGNLRYIGDDDDGDDSSR